jgi:hypothetical protein
VKLLYLGCEIIPNAFVKGGKHHGLLNQFPKYRKCDLSLLNRCIDAPPLLAIVVTITFYGVWF